MLSAMAARASATTRGSGAERGSVFGRTVLVSGPEALLADRAVGELRRRVMAEAPEADISEVESARLDPARLVEMTSPSLFAARRAVIITDAANLPAEFTPDVVAVAAARMPDLAFVVVHGGGVKGKGLLDKLKAAGVEVIDCPAVKAWELPQFVAAEARKAGSGIDQGAAQVLVDAVGHDLRALAAAVGQLLADGDGTPISEEHVGRYFGGRSEVTSFAVADAVLAGRTTVAMEQLRWALSTGVAPVLLTSALASGLRGLGKLMTAGGGLREADLAREVGVPPWKLKSMRAQVRGWDQAGLARALTAVARADADVKGAADDADFALERALLSIASARSGS